MPHCVMGIEEIKKILPQEPPFLMLDRVIEIKEWEFLKAVKFISLNEPRLAFSEEADLVFPRMLCVEAMAQAACILVQKSIHDLNASEFLITRISMDFFKSARPGDTLRVTAKSVKMTRIGGVFETEAAVNNDCLARGGMTFACR